MPYIQRTTPPPNKIINFSLQNFNGGLNNRSVQLEANQASNLLNMKFADETLMEKRFGQVYHGDVDADSALVFLDEYKPYTGDNQFVYSTNVLITIGEVTHTITSTPSGINHNGFYYFVDGAKLYVYGKFPQEDASPHIDVIGAPVDAYIVMEIITPTAGFTPLGISYNEGLTKYDYTNKQICYEPCANEIADPYKNGNVVPGGAKYITSHEGRLFVSGDDKDDDNIFISDVENGFYFPASLPIQLPPNSDEIKGLKVYDNGIVVGRKDDIHVITGVTNNPELGLEMFQLRKLNTHCGFANHQCAVAAHNYLFFIGSDGNMYSLSTIKLTERLLATTIISKTIDITKTPINATLTDLATATSIFFNDEWLISIDDKVLVYSYRHQAWTMYEDVNATTFYKLGEALIWGRSDGRIAKFDDGYLDFGVPFKAFWTSKYFDMGEPSAYKLFREFYVIAQVYTDVRSDVQMTFNVDYLDISGIQLLTNQISIWGKSKWGELFNKRNIAISLPFTLGQRGRLLRFTFTNGYDLHDTVTSADELTNYPVFEGCMVYVSDDDEYHVYSNNTWEVYAPSYLDQTMKVHQINGDYELKSKR